MTQSSNSMAAAIKKFEITEANLVKLERLWSQIRARIPDHISFGNDPDYDDMCRAFQDILHHLPKIGGWKPSAEILPLNAIAQMRLDANDIGEIEYLVSIDNAIDAPGLELREYRYHFNRKRKELIREQIVSVIGYIDKDIQAVRRGLPASLKGNERVSGENWDSLKQHVNEIDALLGSSVSRPMRWLDLRRHLNFGYIGDFNDIETLDWPAVREGLEVSLYEADDPIPVDVDDLADLVAEKPRGRINTRLKWQNISDEEFERLIFTLLSTTPTYENSRWLMQTRAPDRGRDLSAERVSVDPLGGVRRERVIVQCKHWQGRSVAISDIAQLKEQIRLWQPPRVDVCIVATSGRFTLDAVNWVEQHNQSDTGLYIDMWPESHIETLLASRPDLIAEFHLR